MSAHARAFAPLLFPAAVLSCSQANESHDDADEPQHEVHATAPASPPRQVSSARQIDGRAFPDHVIALTWDDGPDAHTLELARYLHAHHVSATFFVVADWRKGLSSDPGYGPHVYDTGYVKIPILGDLVRLGHRLGNHTSNHVILTDADARTVADELHQNELGIDPYVTNELRIFRVPGGAWGPETAGSAFADPFVKGLVGPVRWDVDRKDWQSSASCNSTHPHSECELGTRGLRTKPSVIARRYFSSITSAGRGIVLLHDRVADVGSRYALELAEALVPELKAAGFVFAAPVLAFSPLALRLDAPLDPETLRFADVDGDGRADACGRGDEGYACYLAFDRDDTPHAAFRPTPIAPPADETAVRADLNGDGKPDVCARGKDGVVCALAGGHPERWSKDFGDAYPGTFRFGDLNGDGRADICGRAPDGLVCALSTGRAFASATYWARAGMTDADGWLAPARAASLQLADINGDGRADLCGMAEAGVVCGLAP